MNAYNIVEFHKTNTSKTTCHIKSTEIEDKYKRGYKTIEKIWFCISQPANRKKVYF